MDVDAIYIQQSSENVSDSWDCYEMCILSLFADKLTY